MSDFHFASSWLHLLRRYERKMKTTAGMIFTIAGIKNVYTMKKFFSVFLLIPLAYSLSAQNVSLGPSAGIEHSWITGMENVKFKPGFSVGGVLTYSPSPHWGLGGDIRFSFYEGVKTGAQTAESEQ